jgi:hypothetical protein
MIFSPCASFQDTAQTLDRDLSLGHSCSDTAAAMFYPSQTPLSASAQSQQASSHSIRGSTSKCEAKGPSSCWATSWASCVCERLADSVTIYTVSISSSTVEGAFSLDELRQTRFARRLSLMSHSQLSFGLHGLTTRQRRYDQGAASGCQPPLHTLNLESSDHYQTE